MSKAIFLISLFLVAGIASASKLDTYNALWQAWKLKHNKNYALGEESARFGIFIENVNKITRKNQENSDVKFALNKFADLTASEFKAIYASGSRAQIDPEAQKNHVTYNLRDLPDEVDWRGKGAVTPVKDQGQCGSCWAFSATGVIEGFYYINNGHLLSFSEQQILDCDVGGEDQGCNGGWHYLAVRYAGKNGLETEKDYPYRASKGKCKFDATKATKTNTDFAYVKANSTEDLKTALVAGPVSIAIEADQDVFQFYSRGVISAGCGANIDHAVLAVGYQKVGKLEAFIVKNSWGRGWGDKGYVLISTIQQLNKGRGACGILSIPVIVT